MTLSIARTVITLPRRAGGDVWYLFGRALTAGLARLLLELDVAGQDAIPAGAKVLACNHPTTIDPVLMTLLVPEPVSILISETLFKLPVLGPSLRWSGHIRVVHAAGRGAFEAGLARLEAGRTVGVFPEGALSPAPGRLAPLHSGAVRLAMASGVPIIPVGAAPQAEKVRRIDTLVDGQVEHGAWLWQGKYALSVGRPFWPQGSPDDRAQVARQTAELGARIARLAEESQRRIK